jgi:hypothetical protein
LDKELLEPVLVSVTVVINIYMKGHARPYDANTGKQRDETKEEE